MPCSYPSATQPSLLQSRCHRLPSQLLSFKASLPPWGTCSPGLTPQTHISVMSTSVLGLLSETGTQHSAVNRRGSKPLPPAPSHPIYHVCSTQSLSALILKISLDSAHLLFKSLRQYLIACGKHQKPSPGGHHVAPGGLGGHLPEGAPGFGPAKISPA